MNYCTNCQAAILLDAAFCPECGLQVDRELPNEISSTNTNKFTFAIAPFLYQMDYGNYLMKPIQWLFILQGIASLIYALWTIHLLKKAEAFSDATAFAIVYGIFSLFTGWIGFQLWWYRQKHILATTKNEDEFKAIPLFSYYLQTSGEWYAIYVMIMGIGVTIAKLFIDDQRQEFISLIFLSNMILPKYFSYNSILTGLAFSILAGFLIFLISRFIAEFIRAIASIANNTKPIK